MKKTMMTAWVMLLGVTAKASDLGVQLPVRHINRGNTIAREGTGTCVEASMFVSKERPAAFDQLRLAQVREMMNAAQSEEERQAVLDALLNALEAE